MRFTSSSAAGSFAAFMFFSVASIATENNAYVEKTIALPMISVLSTQEQLVAESQLDLISKPPEQPYSDAADYLRSVSGITSGRAGGHGLDLVIRGQSQNQLNVLNQQTTTFGACPNRMDPPSVYSNLNTFDSVTIVRGYQSVLNGPGGPGGSLLFEREQPSLTEAFETTGELAAGYDTNGESKFAHTNLLAGTERAYIRARASSKEAENYQDGRGKSVRSAFFEKTAGLTLGLMPEDGHVRLNYDVTDIDDALFPGAGMDSPYSTNHRLSARYERDFMHPSLKHLGVTAYGTRVDHEMDNFTLRPRVKAPFKLVDSTSDTYGFVIKNDWLVENQEVKTRIDVRQNARDAVRYQGGSPANVNMTQAYLWPDIQLTEIGLGAETDWQLSETNTLIAGIRYDFVDVDYNKANREAVVTGRSANDLYQSFYGTNAKAVKEHHLGGILRLEHAYSPDLSLYGAISRSVRTADATERGLANDMIMMGMNKSWVGNPNIKAEKHHQLEFGASHRPGDWQYGASLYFDYVNDFILKDSARGQEGILINATNATVYRNIDALITGLELTTEWKVKDKLTVNADATLTLGHDLDSNQPLAQIPPLQGSLMAVWQPKDQIDVHGVLSWAAKQSRANTNRAKGSGRDLGETSGYAVFDVFATFRCFQPVEISFGVSNLFDKTYANHLNRENVFDAEKVQVNEPGRSVFLKTRFEF